MTVHFATARTAASSPVARILTRPRLGSAANDNEGSVADDRLLHAALRHFAEHGLAAARMAHERAELAFMAGKSETYDWWRGVCRTLDRRLAGNLVREMENRLAT